MNASIEALRGVAAMMVLVHHYSYPLDATLTRDALHFLHSGVDLFFVITGFLFAPYLLGQVKEPVAAFAVRRGFRLMPLYILSLSVAVLKDLGVREGLGLALVKHLSFVQALPVFSLAEVGYFTQIYWTLPVEVMFYALVALVMVGASPPGSRSGRAWRVGVYGGVAALAFVLVVAIGHNPQRESWVVWQAQLPALLLHFWFGLLVFVARPRLQALAAARRAVLTAGLSALAAGYLLYPGAVAGALTARPFGLFNLLTGLAYALVLAAVVAGNEPGNHVVRAWAIRAGALSYGVYLFHEWTLKVVQRLLPAAPALLQVTAALALVLVLAWLLHHLVEAPLRVRGRTLASRLTLQAPVDHLSPAGSADEHRP